MLNLIFNFFRILTILFKLSLSYQVFVRQKNKLIQLFFKLNNLYFKNFIHKLTEAINKDVWSFLHKLQSSTKVRVYWLCYQFIWRLFFLQIILRILEFKNELVSIRSLIIYLKYWILSYRMILSDFCIGV